MAKQGKLPTAAEFENWLKPSDALARLPADWNVRTKQDAILSRITDGSLIAFARSGSIRDGGGIRPFGLTTIDPQLWSEPWRCRDRNFWATGDITYDNDPGFDIAFSIEPKQQGPTVTISYRDVRIEPGSFDHEFAAHLPREVPKAAAAVAHSEPLSEEEFAGWLTPKAALAAAPSEIEEPQRRAWIMRRLREGLILARSESMAIIDINGREEAQRAAVERRFWKWRELGDWFSGGDLEVTDAPEVNSAGKRLSLDAYNYEPEKGRITRYTEATFLGVRLDPAAFPRPKQRTNKGAPTPEEFEGWLHPSDVTNHYYQQGGGDDEATAKSIARLSDGFLQAAAGELVINGKNLGLALIPRELWDLIGRTDVWVTGRFRLTAKGQSISAYDVKIDPQERELPGPDEPTESPPKLAKTKAPTPAPVKTKGGRPAGKDGEPIARLTKRLIRMSPEERSALTVEAVTADLIEEYRTLGLRPPHLDNARRNAAGILKAAKDE